MPSVLQIHERPLPDVNPGEVRVKIQTIGLNYAEIQSRKGLYGWAPKLPYTLGMEAFGTIDAVADNVTAHKIGDAVIVANQIGAYAEYISIPAEQALPAIPEYSPEENAAFAVNYMTAWVGIMEMARARPSDTILIQAAAGGVGTAAVNIAKHYGCKAYGTIGSDHKAPLLHKLGIDGIINYRSNDFRSKLLELNNDRGVDIVLEVVGGDVFRKSLKSLNPFGRVVVLGFASLDLKKWNPLSWIKTWKSIPRVNISDLATHSSGVLASHIGYLLKDTKRLMRVWSDLTQFTTKHEIRPTIGHTFSFADLPEGHRLMESRKSQGKIVIKV